MSESATEPDDDGRDRLEVPGWVRSEIFPFEGDLRVKQVQPYQASDQPRSGEPGGEPCLACAKTDDDCIWVDDYWRVSTAKPIGLPIQLFLETRDHLDMDDLDDQRSAELGLLTVRLDRAIQAIGGIGRVHVARWGDGAAHFHMWFFARPVGASQLRGFGMPMWAMLLPPTDQATWDANKATVGRELAKHGGRAINP